MNGFGLRAALVFTAATIAVAACSEDDDDDAASTGGTPGAAGSGGSAGASQTGSGGVTGDGIGTAGVDGEGIAGSSGKFDEDCREMCGLVRVCDVPEDDGAAGSSGGGAGGEAGAPGDSAVSLFDQCMKDCDFIEAGLSMDPCRPEFEEYFACLGGIDADAVECADGNVRWDLYCQTESTTLIECQAF